MSDIQQTQTAHEELMQSADDFAREREGKIPVGRVGAYR